MQPLLIFITLRYDDFTILEDWMSGLNQRFTKPSTFNRVREFESHILRHFVLARDAYKISVI